MLSLLIAPLTAEAQPAAKVPRIGVLANNSLASVSVHYIEPFRQGLRDLGYVEGQNIVVEYRFAEWQEDRLPALTAELLQFPVEVLVTLAAPATRVARQATTTIPIVFMIVNDPVGQGFVASLAQPGGNVTGVSTLSSELSGKRLELLQEAVPGLRRVALLWNAANPGMALQFHEAQAAAHGLGLELHSVEVRGPDECDRALAAALEAHAEGLVVLAGTPVRSRTQIVDFAAAHRLPAIYAESEIVKAGGLMSYGPHYGALARRAPIYVDKILKGVKPAALPVEQPTKFELIINLKTAQALGMTMPPSLLLLADEVIQ
jgi:putative tryptophan/tyrosine transport system substrate-binding protein